MVWGDSSTNPTSQHLIHTWITQTLTNVDKFGSFAVCYTETNSCTYAHRHAQAVAWSCVISPSGSWRTAGMLIKFDCSLCRIYNSLHFSAFNKLRIQRGSPEPLPRICTRTHKVKGLSSHLRVPRHRPNETSTWMWIVYNVRCCTQRHFKYFYLAGPW